MLIYTEVKRWCSDACNLQVQRLVRTRHNPFDYDEEWEAEMREGGRYTVAWKNIEAAGTVYPEYSTDAADLILDLLGYLPYLTVYLPHEIPIRVLVAQHKAGQLTQAQFREQVKEHVRHIRNDDLLREDILAHPSRRQKEIDRYATYLKDYAAEAKERITQLLGYKPVRNCCCADMQRKES